MTETTLETMANSLPDFDDSTCVPDQFYTSGTIQLGELIEGGFIDWTATDWAWPDFEIDKHDGNGAQVDTAIRTRLCEMFNQAYYWDDISITPPGRWKQRLLYKLTYELQPKYQPLYQKVADGLSYLADEDEYTKGRDISSEFPETLISGNSDYLSSGTDSEHERIKIGNTTDALNKYYNYFRGVDQAFIEELSGLFMKQFAFSTNYF